ncbi:hypothetical protein ACFYTQ_35710 [Nocardia sp. NPDC004068]|uniref:hypothetical protein n=1 Tax=Nocardia sp. NPDC004068 TaxID=3364303 RepID=UPI0036A541E1
MRTTAGFGVVLAAAALTLGLGGGIASADGDEWEGDHTAIDPGVCIDNGGSVEGSICVGGSYTGYIVL